MKRKSKVLFYSVVIVAVIGEAICLIHYGFIHKDQAGAFCIVSGWVKDLVRKLVNGG